jgi:hypothetical protein
LLSNTYREEERLIVKTVTITPVEAQKKIEAAVPANAEIVHYDDSADFASLNSAGKGFDWIKEQIQGGRVQQYRAARAKGRTGNSRIGEPAVPTIADTQENRCGRRGEIILSQPWLKGDRDTWEKF